MTRNTRGLTDSGEVLDDLSAGGCLVERLHHQHGVGAGSSGVLGQLDSLSRASRPRLRCHRHPTRRLLDDDLVDPLALFDSQRRELAGDYRMEPARAGRCRSESRRGRAGDPSSTGPSAPNGVETAARMPLSFFVIFSPRVRAWKRRNFATARGLDRAATSHYSQIADCRQVHKGLGARSVSLNQRKWVLNWRNDSLMSLGGCSVWWGHIGAAGCREHRCRTDPGSGDGLRHLLTGSLSEGPAGRRKPGGGVLHRVPGRHPHHHGSGLTIAGAGYRLSFARLNYFLTMGQRLPSACCSPSRLR